MKTPLFSSFAATKKFRRCRRQAFSLVEVTLALGIVTFGLVGVVGVLPVALASGRQSFDQNRAAAIANTIFTSIRSQPFDKVSYLDDQFASDGVTPATTSAAPVLNLNSSTQTSLQPTLQAGGTPSSVSSNMVQFYATFLDVATESDASLTAYGAQRRLSFTAAKPKEGTSYLVTLFFNNAPDGMVIHPPADNQAANPPAQANRIDLLVSPASEANQPTQAKPTQRPLDQYRFASTVGHRAS